MTSSAPSAPQRCQDIQKALQAKAQNRSWAVQGPISVRDNSEVYRACAEAGARSGTALAVKVCLDPNTGQPDRASAVEQFRALRRAHAAMGHNHTAFQVPQAWCLRPRAAAYAMQWVDGLPLDLLMNRPALLRQGPAWFASVGQWLGHFHAAGPVRRQAFDLGERLAVLRSLQANPMPGPLFLRAASALAQAAPGLAGAPLSISWLHGDCKAENFFLAGDSVCGLDISLRFENPVEYDLAQFLNNLALAVFHPRRLLPALLLPRLESAFLGGYRRSGPEVSAPHLAWLRLSFALSFWQARSVCAGSGLRARLLQASFHSLVRRLVQAPAFSD